MSALIASGIFYGIIGAFVYFLYQAAILPGIRQTLRFEIFKLRDDLRSLVVEGTVKEQDRAVRLLEAHLNFMLSNLPRFDAYGAFRALRMADEQKRREAERYMQLMANAPERVRLIYEDSIKTFMKAMVFNSIFVAIVLTALIVVGTLCRVGVLRLVDSVRTRTHEDSQLAFFRCSEVVV